MNGTKAPVIFIHGLWLHASSWAPWQERFRDAGYDSSAPAWPGDADTVEATRATPTPSRTTASTKSPLITHARSTSCRRRPSSSGTLLEA